MDPMSLLGFLRPEVDREAESTTTRPLFKRKRPRSALSLAIRSEGSPGTKGPQGKPRSLLEVEEKLGVEDPESDSGDDDDDSDHETDEPDEAVKRPHPPNEKLPPPRPGDPIGGGEETPESTLTETIATSLVSVPDRTASTTDPTLVPIQSLITESATGASTGTIATSSAPLADTPSLYLSDLPPAATPVASSPGQTSSPIVSDSTPPLVTTAPEAVITTSAGTSEPKINRAAAAGIAFGSIALVSLIIVGIFLFWRRRRSNTEENFNHFPAEKHLPSTPTDHIYDHRGPPLRTNSDIMDEAMAAVYAAEDGNHPGTRVSIDTTLSFDDQGRYRNPARPVSPLSPTADRPPELDPVQNTPENPGVWYGGTLFPPTVPNDQGIYPPGQVPIDHYHVPSIAQTEHTEATESSWRTWNVDQTHAHNKPKPWKERFLA